MSHYLVRHKSLWGDYGSVLMGGTASIGEDGIQLSRVGPFVPPISLPRLAVGTLLVVAGSCKEQLPEYDHQLITKSKVVSLDWHKWPESNRPRVYPPSDEPIHYITRLAHCDAASQAMGDVYAVELPDCGCLSAKRVSAGNFDYSVSRNEVHGIKLFYAYRPQDSLRAKKVVVNEDGREMLTEIGGNWLEFVPVSSS